MSDKERLEQIESLSELQFNSEEISIIVGMKFPEMVALLNSQEGPVYEAFERGRLKAEAEVRKSILKLAKQGSTPAQKQMMELIAQNKKALSKQRS